MAWVLKAHTQGAPVGAGGVTTPSVDATGGDLIVCNVEGVGPSPVTDSQGNTYIALTRPSGSLVQMFYCLAPSVSASMTFTCGGVVTNIQVQVWAGSLSFDQESQNHGGDTPTAITAAANGALYVTGFGGQNTMTFTINNGFTITDQYPGSGVAVPGAIAYKVQTTAASLAPTWSVTGGGSHDSAMAVFLASTVQNIEEDLTMGITADFVLVPMAAAKPSVTLAITADHLVANRLAAVNSLSLAVSAGFAAATSLAAIEHLTLAVQPAVVTLDTIALHESITLGIVAPEVTFHRFQDGDAALHVQLGLSVVDALAGATPGTFRPDGPSGPAGIFRAIEAGDATPGTFRPAIDVGTPGRFKPTE